MSTDTAAVPVPVPAEAPATPAAPAAGLFDSIDWKNPVPAVIKLATHLHSLDKLTAAERLTMLQGSLLYVINTSSLPELEKDAARAFVATMVPHVVETAVSGIEAAAKVALAEKKAADIMESVMSKQPNIVVKNVETALAGSRGKWWCW
jgi:hypothetical protein